MKIHELSIREGRELGDEYPFVTKGPLCSAEGRTLDKRQYICTRAPHNNGPHVAHGTRGILAVWSD